MNNNNNNNTNIVDIDSTNNNNNSINSSSNNNNRNGSKGPRYDKRRSIYAGLALMCVSLCYLYINIAYQPHTNHQNNNNNNNKNDYDKKQSSLLMSNMSVFASNEAKNAFVRFNSYGIPQLIHQTWKSSSAVNMQSNLFQWQQSCQSLNSNNNDDRVNGDKGNDKGDDNSYQYRYYSDVDIEAFMLKYYHYIDSNDRTNNSYVNDNKVHPYYELYRSLSGVYMSDMMRLLLVYHYGGIYMDLDFYCYKPMECMMNHVMDPYYQTIWKDKLMREDGNVGTGDVNASKKKQSQNNLDILIVSREPIIHALMFRNKTRVVIQDFFMATPKHPFIKWLLDDRVTLYQQGNRGKGPFSYSIDKDIDQYLMLLKEKKEVNELALGWLGETDNNYVLWKYQRTNQVANNDLGVEDSNVVGDYYSAPTVTASSSGSSAQARPIAIPAAPKPNPGTNKVSSSSSTRYASIIELEESVLHPLLDSSNAKLWVDSKSVCSKGTLQQLIDSEKRSHDPFATHDQQQWKRACERWKHNKYFAPSNSTIAVHMWSHLHLAMPALRAKVSTPIFSSVESKLKPVRHC